MTTRFTKQFGKAGPLFRTVQDQSKKMFRSEALPRFSSRLDSRLDVRRNQLMNLVNVSFDELIAIVFSFHSFWMSYKIQK